MIDFEAFFGGELPEGSEWGRVVEETAQPHLGGMELFGTKQGEPRIAALSLTSETFANPNFTYTNRDIYFPHVARDTQSFWTAIAFVNTSGDPVDIALVAYGDEGQVMAEEPITMEPFGKEVGIVHNLFSQLDATAEISWVRLQSTGPVAGYELFGDNTGNDKRLAGFSRPSGRQQGSDFPKKFSTNPGFITPDWQPSTCRQPRPQHWSIRPTVKMEPCWQRFQTEPSDPFKKTSPRWKPFSAARCPQEPVGSA